MVESVKSEPSLAYFPAEVLELITRSVLASDITQLYMCGNVAFNRKLRQGGVRELTVLLTKDMPKWSFKLVKHFKLLRSFKIWSPGRVIPGFDMQVVDRLPRELEVLEIVSPQSNTLWTVAHSPRDGFESWTTYRITSKFPFLKRLKLTDSNEIPDAPSTSWDGTFGNPLPDEVLDGLPGSLREFETSGTQMGSSHRAQKLPRRLTSLIVHRELNNALYLPKAITKLHINDLKTDWLPPHLTSLMVGNAYVSSGISAAFPLGLSELHLPHLGELPFGLDLGKFLRLQTLDIGAVGQCTAQFPLPPRLTALRIGNWALTPAFFNWLPQSITRLDIKSDNIESNSSASMFPKALYHLYMPFCIYIDDEFMQLLPKTVQIMRSPLVSRYYGVIMRSELSSFTDNTPWSKP